MIYIRLKRVYSAIYRVKIETRVLIVLSNAIVISVLNEQLIVIAINWCKINRLSRLKNTICRKRDWIFWAVWVSQVKVECSKDSAGDKPNSDSAGALSRYRWASRTHKLVFVLIATVAFVSESVGVPMARLRASCGQIRISGPVPSAKTDYNDQQLSHLWRAHTFPYLSSYCNVRNNCNCLTPKTGCDSGRDRHSRNLSRCWESRPPSPFGRIRSTTSVESENGNTLRWYPQTRFCTSVYIRMSWKRRSWTTMLYLFWMEIKICNEIIG